MNKTAIWIIIGLMAAALNGIAWIQVDMINAAIKANEEKFDKDVFEVLNAVVQHLEEEEELEESNFYNGFMTSYYERLQRKEGNLSIDVQLNKRTFKDSDGILLQNQAGDRVCRLCGQAVSIKNTKPYQAFIGNRSRSNLSLENRIKLDHIKEVLNQELANRGIDTDYNYGVFSNKKNSFVIANDYYVVEDENSYKNIARSKYQVHLFPKEVPSPGALMVYFPAKSTFVRSSLLKNLLGAILFTLIILVCFAYTINVIFKQKKLSEMKTDFVNNMTHEFKTPIATISLAADSINSPRIAGNPDKVKRFANIIKQENKRMNSQVEKVLQMALLDKKDFGLNLTQVNLHDVIHRAVENIGLQVEKKEGTATAFLQANKAMVEGDLTHISNVINNLLDNANKYSPEKPEISVHTRNVSNGVEVIIKDKGIGMSKEARKHIFDKFYRVHTGDLHDVKGFGLGLSYVKAIMNAHKGYIDVKSELGKGSSFVLIFPFRVENKV